MNDVFLSYAREDQPRAQRLAAALEAQGWKVWWDKHIATGKTFDEVIQQALDDTRSVVVLWSDWSIKSNWVKEEAAEGARREILVPCLIDDVRIPLGFGRIQTASLVGWEGDADHPGFQQLCGALTTSIETSTARATARFATVPKPAADSRPLGHAPTPPPAVTAGSPWRRLRAPLLAALAAAVIGGAGYAALAGLDPADEERERTPRIDGETVQPGEDSGAEVEPGPAGGPGSGDAGGEPVAEAEVEAPPRLVWVSGRNFAQAVELARGTHREQVASQDSPKECGLVNEGETFVAWLKAGALGNSCQFQLNQGVRLRPVCRIVDLDFEEPAGVRWITPKPRPPIDDPAIEVRMWANSFQGKRKLKFRKWQLEVPADTPTYKAGDLTLVDAPTLAGRCLEAAAPAAMPPATS